MSGRGKDAAAKGVLDEELSPGEERLGSTSYELFILLISILSLVDLDRGGTQDASPGP